MSAAILTFDPPRPYVLLYSPGILTSGDRFYLVDLFLSDADGGGVAGVFDGVEYDLAREAALDIAADGIRFLDVTGETA